MPMTLGPNSILVRPNNNILNTKYFKYLIDSLYGKSLLDKIISGTTQKKFNKTGFRNLEIPLPPLAEQDRIVAKLDAAFTEIDGAIEGSKKQETEVLKYGYRAITNTLKNLANIYSSKPLNDVVIIQPKKKLALEKISESDDVSFMGMKELGIEQKYTEAINTKPLNEVFKSYQYFEENDVVFAKITPCYQNGKLGIMKNLKNGIGFGSSEFVVLRPNSEVHSEYIYYCLLDETFRKNGTKNMSGAVGHKRVTKDYYFNYQIAVPPLSMQIECIKEFDEIWKHAEIISKLKHKKINELISLKSAILKRELQSSEAA
jgi:type I restriction enzyme S subunit